MVRKVDHGWESARGASWPPSQTTWKDILTLMHKEEVSLPRRGHHIWSHLDRYPSHMPAMFTVSPFTDLQGSLCRTTLWIRMWTATPTWRRCLQKATCTMASISSQLSSSEWKVKLMPLFYLPSTDTGEPDLRVSRPLMINFTGWYVIAIHDDTVVLRPISSNIIEMA